MRRRLTGQIIRFPVAPVRSWLVLKVRPGEWRGDLHHRARGEIARTEEGALHLVRDTIRHNYRGLPVFYSQDERGVGPTAA